MVLPPLAAQGIATILPGSLTLLPFLVGEFRLHTLRLLNRLLIVTHIEGDGALEPLYVVTNWTSLEGK